MRSVDDGPYLEIKPFTLIERRLSRQQVETHLMVCGWAPMIATTKPPTDQLPALGIGSTQDFRLCRYQRFSPNPVTTQTRFADAWVETEWHHFGNTEFWDCVKKMVAAGWLALP